MAEIKTEDTHEAFATARRLFSQKITEAEAVKHLVLNRGMNAASASDYVRNFRQMMEGKSYHRTLNAYATAYYLRSIRQYYGEELARNALKSVRLHIDYYRSVSGSSSPGICKICDEFELELSAKSLTETRRDFEFAVKTSEALSPADRNAALRIWPTKPKARLVSATVFDRNPHVVAAVLVRADGRCESCHVPAPFQRKSEGSPYLEVHHKIQLADGGMDTVENATAVCPNCHRRAHFG